ncbi:MAG: Crp/Fnr family transcriptional regulator [Oscillospiraceae bacterium]
MLQQQDIERVKDGFSFWDHLNKTEQEQLLNNTSVQLYSAGTFLRGSDSPCVGVLLVKKGVLRAYLLSDEGREITLYRMREGEICVLSAACVLDFFTFNTHIAAEEDCEVLLLSLPFFTSLMEQNIYAECFSYKMAADRFSDIMWAMQQVLFLSLDKRLAGFLLQKSKREQGALKLTHEQIARDIGSTREVVTRMLKYFADEGVVKLSRGKIDIVDCVKLAALEKE